MANGRNSKIIKYFNLGYDDFKKDLKDFSRIYHPNNSKDLSEGSSAQMMLEQASYVGDVLSFYLENRFANSNLLTAKDIDQIFVLARSKGYPIGGPTAATGETNFYIEVPATTGSLGGYIPNMRYAPNFRNVQLQNSNGIGFEAVDDINFKEVNISSSFESKVSRRTSSGIPSHFVLKKRGGVTAGKTITEVINVGDYEPFYSIEISEPNVLDIKSVEDSSGDKYYEVNYLAQKTIFEGVRNFNEDSESVPYALKLKPVPKRFIKRVNPSTGKTTIVFGSGKETDIGDSFVPDPSDVALDLKGKLTFAPSFIDPQNFLKSRSLGLSPHNTTITIKARVGGGRITNTSVNSLKDIVSKEVELDTTGLDTQELNNTLNSFSTNNDDRITGGNEAPTPEEIKENALAFFGAQGRLNSKPDYIARSLSLPSKFGKIFRVYPTTNCTPNGGVQLYVIAKNENDQLISPPHILKKNLKNYLSNFSRLGQGIDILDGRIINIGIEWLIVVDPDFNKTQVKLETLSLIKEHFNVNKWQLNQPIFIDDIRCLINDVEGVLSISELKIINKNNLKDGNQYSEHAYSIESNTKNGIIFAPENGMFEVKFLNTDLKVAAL